MSFVYLYSALTLFENNMMVCDVLLSSPEKTLNFFDLALLEAQSVIMETHHQKEDMVKCLVAIVNNETDPGVKSTREI